MSDVILWWGYVHTNGGLQVKRYFDQRDLAEAHESDFVASVHGPWGCDSREDALTKLKNASTVTYNPPA